VTSHAPPAGRGFRRIRGFTKHLALKCKNRIATEHGLHLVELNTRHPINVGIAGSGKALAHSGGFGFGQQLHQLSRIRRGDRLFIHTAHHHAMGNGSLLEQTAPCRRSRGQQQHPVLATKGSLAKASPPQTSAQHNGEDQPITLTGSAQTLLTDRSLHRARQAIRCLPFAHRLYALLEHGALSSTELTARSDWGDLCPNKLNRSRTEDTLIWLIQLGVLRREVDGQGLTERVRLTPMGRELLQAWPDAIPPAPLHQRLHHWLRRHRPRL